MDRENGIDLSRISIYCERKKEYRNGNESEDHKKVTRCEFIITYCFDDGSMEPAGIVKAYVFNNKLNDPACMAKQSDYVMLGGKVCPEASVGFRHLFKQKEFPGSRGDSNSAFIYLSEFYIKKKFRRNGIGKFVLQSILDIIEDEMDVSVAAAFTYIRPYTIVHNLVFNGYVSENKSERTPEEKKMTKVMEHLFDESGWTPVNRSKKYYIT